MLGVLVIEDLIVVGLLAAITSIVGYGSIDLSNLTWLGIKIIAFVLGSLVIGILVVPRIIDKTSKLGNNEVLILLVLGLCFGLSIIADLLGFSMAIGAFLMGVIVASAKSAEQLSALISPIKDIFAAVFFVSMGALIDITQFRAFLLPAALVTFLMITGKILGCGLGTRAFKYDSSTSLKVGLGMSQIGEFAFIVMKVGQDLNVVSSFLFPIVGVAAAITTFLTPYTIQLSYKLNLTRLSYPNKVKP
jgi:CPA2 family monovalent cation:H+ antiporter-2